MNSINTYNKRDLSSMTLKEITEYNTALCKIIKATPTKRFATKDKAISKTLSHVVIYNEKLAEKNAKKPADKPTTSGSKPSKRKLFELDSIVSGGPVAVNLETAMGILATPIITEDVTVEELINHFIKNFKQKRGGSVVDVAFARSYLTGALRAGHLVILK